MSRAQHFSNPLSLATIATLVLMLSGCGGDQRSSASTLDNTNLSGTWVSRSKSDFYLQETGEHTYSGSHDFVYIIRDDALGTAVNRCLEQGKSRDRYAPRTESHLLLWDRPYKFLNPNLLEYSAPDELSFGGEEIIRTRLTLHRISRQSIIDFGSLTLNGDLSVNEDTHVCSSSVSFRFNAGAFYTDFPHVEFAIGAPIDNLGVVWLSLMLRSTITPGVYNYAVPSRDGDTDFVLDVDCSSDECIAITGDDLNPVDVTLNLQTFTPERVTGSFSFTQSGGKEGSYTGTFDIIPPMRPLYMSAP